MSSYEPILLLTAFCGLAAIAYLTQKTNVVKEKFVGGFGKRNLWFVVDDFGVNSRRWTDFGSRSSKDINIGLLKITKTRCAITQGGDFTINEVYGRQALAQVIREHNGFVPDYHLQIPHYLWAAWARASLLAYAGGLYLDGFSLCLGPSFASVVDSADNIVFGLDRDPLTVNPYAGWAKVKGSTVWLTYVDALIQFIAKGPLSWDSGKARNQIASWNASILTNAKVLLDPEWSRLPDGRVIEVEDLIDRSLGGEFQPGPNAIYVPINSERLERAVSYNWFLRMSGEQILDPDSNFLWAQLAQKTATKDKLTIPN